MNALDKVMQMLGEPPATMINCHGVVACDNGVLEVCVRCRDSGRLSVLRDGKCAVCAASRAEFCPCGGRLIGDRCENGCRAT